MLKELVEYIAKSLVDHPEEVEVHEVIGEKTTILELKVADDDLGKVIGKQGRIAQSMRTVVKAAATKQNKRAVLEILEPQRY
ncbi:MAG: KH domain-containing protein [bacterium]